jgi:hypothetical protein
MAKKLDNFPNDEFGQPNRKYAWDEWLNGEIWELTRGEDFDIRVDHFRAQAFTNAKRRGMKLRTNVTDERIILQAYKEVE